MSGGTSDPCRLKSTTRGFELRVHMLTRFCFNAHHPSMPAYLPCHTRGQTSLQRSGVSRHSPNPTSNKLAECFQCSTEFSATALARAAPPLIRSAVNHAHTHCSKGWLVSIIRGSAGRPFARALAI
jgi:hypothetical protein